jgi:carnitine-CoA ligase
LTRTFRDFVPTFPDRSQWTVPAILRERAATHAERIYLDVPSEGLALTYAETHERAERIARSLVAAGGRLGDRVLIMAPNCSEMILTWLGAAAAGLVEVPINTAYRGSFFEHQARTIAPRFAVVHTDHVDVFVESAAALTTVERCFIVGPEEARGSAAESLAAVGLAAAPFEALLDPVDADLPHVRAQDLVAVFFTSGTTGLSKGVMMPHAQFTFFADECVSLTRLTDQDTYMSVGPLFHGNAQFLAAYPALVAGARFVLRERFSASNWVDWARESRATVTNFVGVMMDFVWKQPHRPDDADNDLRCVFAAPTASSILAAFQERFGIEAFVEVFGLTETSMPILSPYGVDRPAGAAGLVADEWFDVRLADPETDEEVAVGEVGELLVRSKVPWTTSLGYFGMPDKTADAFRNLWFHTGDLLRRDEEGWHYFVDRLKDTIRRRGENISSYEVEQAVLEHPGVLECAAVAVPAESEAGEDEVLVAVAGTDVTAAEVGAWCEQRLPRFARPRYVAVRESLPTTPSGKIRKADLRRQLLDEGLSAYEVHTPTGSPS